MASPKTPNTISDKKWADLSRRAEKAAPHPFSSKAVAQRLATGAQQRKASSS